MTRCIFQRCIDCGGGAWRRHNGARLGREEDPLQLLELLAGVAGAQVYGPATTPISGLAYDSRAVKPGDLFVAVKGFHVDGHGYVGQALERGAAAVVVDARHWPAPAGTLAGSRPLVIVPDSRVALAPLATAFYGHPGRELTVVGVTGTKGKSTTTRLVASALAAGGSPVGMISTVDFQIGARQWTNTTRQSTPEAPEVQALLREMVTAGCAYAVVEATSHALSPHWDRLHGCDFDVALFLNIGHEHLDFHGTFEQYRQDKARLFAMLGADAVSGRAKWAIANADDPQHQFFLAAAPAAAQRLTYGLRAAADVRAEIVAATPSGSALRVTTPGGQYETQLALPGTFNVLNSLAALSVALTQGIAPAAALAALAKVRRVRGRMQPIDLGQPFGVIVDYAHNPESFEQVFAMLRPLTTGRMIAVFGSAGERDRAKRPLQGEIAARYCELLVLTDEDPRGENRAAIIAEIAAGVERAGKRAGAGYLVQPDRAAAIRTALERAAPGDLVLLLGKGHEGSIIYADHLLPWDEAGVAEQVLRELGYDKEGAV